MEKRRGEKTDTGGQLRHHYGFQNKQPAILEVVAA
jgi:hypothetical protein